MELCRGGKDPPVPPKHGEKKLVDEETLFSQTARGGRVVTRHGLIVQHLQV